MCVFGTPWYPEKIHADMGRTCQLHRQSSWLGIIFYLINVVNTTLDETTLFENLLYIFSTRTRLVIQTAFMGLKTLKMVATKV